MVEGSVAELLDPEHSLIQLETTNDAAAKEKLLQSKWADVLQEGTSIRLLMNKQTVPQLISDLVGLDVSILSVNSSHSLENYFLSLTTLSGHVEPFCKLSCLKFQSGPALTSPLPPSQPLYLFFNLHLKQMDKVI